MIIAAYAFLSQSYSLLLFVLFLMGCQSTLFGPVKYAYLPQNLSSEELVGGNALVEAGTYVAIILGLIIGGLTGRHRSIRISRYLRLAWWVSHCWAT